MFATVVNSLANFVQYDFPDERAELHLLPEQHNLSFRCCRLDLGNLDKIQNTVIIDGGPLRTYSLFEIPIFCQICGDNIPCVLPSRIIAHRNHLHRQPNVIL